MIQNQTHICKLILNYCFVRRFSKSSSKYLHFLGIIFWFRLWKFNVIVFDAPHSPRTSSPLCQCPCQIWCRAGLLHRPKGSQTAVSLTKHRQCRIFSRLQCGERCSQNLRRGHITSDLMIWIPVFAAWRLHLWICLEDIQPLHSKHCWIDSEIY